MELHSLAHRTELNLARFEGEVIDRGGYTVVRTPSHADYWWGNYILFSSAPRPGDHARWTALYRDEFPYYDRITHMAFSWDTAAGDRGDTGEFERAGFDADEDVALYASQVNPPPKPNAGLVVRPVVDDAGFEEVLELQLVTSYDGIDPGVSRPFARRRLSTCRAMAKAGMGNWFGAFLGDRLAGHLGLFHDGRTALVFDVATHPGFARQGVCGTLVYEASSLALREYGIDALTLDADPSYHALRIYESVGFRKGEIAYSLEWSAS